MACVLMQIIFEGSTLRLCCGANPLFDVRPKNAEQAELAECCERQKLLRCVLCVQCTIIIRNFYDIHYAQHKLLLV